MPPDPRIGARIVRLEEVTSTIDVARRLARKGAEHGTVVIADRQSAGRGRLGRSWCTLPGKSLAITAILREKPGPDHLPLVGMTAALAVVNAARSRLGVRLQTKWPNDVVYRGRKVAGTLAELSGNALLLSLGLNVNGREPDLPPEIRATATTLQVIAGAPLDREALLAAVVAALDRQWGKLLRDPAALLRRWDRLDITRGAFVTITEGEDLFIGTGLGVDPHGCLRVRLADGRVLAFLAADVALLHPP